MGKFARALAAFVGILLFSASSYASRSAEAVHCDKLMQLRMSGAAGGVAEQPS